MSVKRYIVPTENLAEDHGLPTAHNRVVLASDYDAISADLDAAIAERDAAFAQVDALRKELILHQVIEAAVRDVTRWDWGDNDDDCVFDMDKLEKTLGLLDGHRNIQAALSLATGGKS